MEGDPIPDFETEELKEKSLKATESLYKQLIFDVEKFCAQNRKWAAIWFAIYVFIGLSAVLSSSVSAILTFLDLANSTLLFSVAFSSTASAYILTFLDPSSRASKRKAAARKSASLIIKAKKEQAYVSVLAASDSYKKISNLYDQFANLLEDSPEQ